MTTESTLWRQRAAADREAAEAETLTHARERLERSAASYDRLAAQAEMTETARAKKVAAQAEGAGMSILNPSADQVRAFSDEDLLRAYESTDGQPDDPEAETLLAEIERRGLDV